MKAPLIGSVDPSKIGVMPGNQAASALSPTRGSRATAPPTPIAPRNWRRFTARAFVRMIDQSGLDFVCISTTGTSSVMLASAPAHAPRRQFTAGRTPQARPGGHQWVRNVGRFRSPREAIAEEEFPLVQVGGVQGQRAWRGDGGAGDQGEVFAAADQLGR